MTHDNYSEDSLDDPIRLFDPELNRLLQYSNKTDLIIDDPDKINPTHGEKLDLSLLKNTTDLPDTKVSFNSSTNAEIIIDVSEYFQNEVNNINLNNLNKTDVSYNSTTDIKDLEFIEEYIYIEDNTNSAPDKDFHITKNPDDTRNVDLCSIKSLNNKGLVEISNSAKKVSKFIDRECKTVPEVDVYTRIIGTAYQNAKALHDLCFDITNNKIQNNNINNDLRNIDDNESDDKFQSRRCSVTDIRPSKGIQFRKSTDKKKPKRVSRSKSLLLSPKKNQSVNLNDNLTHTKRNDLSKCKETTATLGNKISKNVNGPKIKTGTHKEIISKPGIQSKNNKFNGDNAKIQQSIENSNEPVRDTVLRYASSVPKARRNSISCSSPNDSSNIASFKICKKKLYDVDKIIPHYHRHKASKETHPIKFNSNSVKDRISGTPIVTYKNMSTESSDMRKVSDTCILNLDHSCPESLLPNTNIMRNSDSAKHQTIPMLLTRNTQSHKNNLHTNLSTKSIVSDNPTQNSCINSIPSYNTKATSVPIRQPNIPNCPATYNFVSNMTYTDINNQTENSIGNLSSINNFSPEMPYDCVTSLMPAIYSSQLQNMESSYTNNYNFRTSNSTGTLWLDPSLQFLGYNQYPTYPIYNTNNHIPYQLGYQISSQQSINNLQAVYSDQTLPMTTPNLNDSSYNHNIPALYSKQLPSYVPSVVNESNNNETNSSQSYNQPLSPKSLTINDYNNKYSIKHSERLKDKSSINNISKMSQEPLSYNFHKTELTNNQRQTDKSTAAVKYKLTSNGDHSFVRNDELSRDKLSNQIKELQYSNSIDSTKYPEMLKLLNFPVEKSNSLSNVFKPSFSGKNINSNNHNSNKSTFCTEYSPPILPILSFDAIFEKIENENFLIPYNDSNFIRNFYREQDPRKLTKGELSKMKEKETKKITLDEYKKRVHIP